MLQFADLSHVLCLSCLYAQMIFTQQINSVTDANCAFSHQVAFHIQLKRELSASKELFEETCDMTEQLLER